MNFEKLLAERVFKNTNFSRFYNNLLQVCPSVPSFVYAVLYIPSFTVDRLFLFPRTDKFRVTAPLQPKVTKEVSRKVVTLEIQEVTNKRDMLTFSYHLCYTECVSKIMERSCIVITENFKQEVLKDGFLQKKQIRKNQLGIFFTRAFDKSTKSHARL